MKAVKRFRLPVISKYWRYNIPHINIINTALCYILKLRVDPKSSHHKEKFFSFILYLHEMINVH